MSAITITEAQVLLFEALCLPKWSSLVVGSVSCSGSVRRAFTIKARLALLVSDKQAGPAADLRQR